MKKIISSFLSLTGVVSAGTVFVDVENNQAGFQDLTHKYNAHGAVNYAFDLTESVLTLEGGGMYWSGTGAAGLTTKWKNTTALEEIKNDVGITLTAGQLESMCAANPANANADAVITLSFKEGISYANQIITMYLLVGTPNGISVLEAPVVSGLTNGSISYAIQDGTGFSDALTGVVTDTASIIKIEGVLGAEAVQINLKSSAAKAAGLGAMIYQVIPEPSTATLSLFALAGLAARRRRR